MGDRFQQGDKLHPNLSLVMRRPGIGHNGGPLDMSWEAWVWRRAVASAWKTPKPEIALRRLARAERLGLTYREFAAALMDGGSQLGTVVLSVGLVARVRRVSDGGFEAEARPEMASKIAKFAGRLLLVADGLSTGPLDAAAREALRLSVNRGLDGRVEAICPLTGDERARAGALRAFLRSVNAPRQETFLVGTGFADADLARLAGLPLFKWAHEWFAVA